MDTNVSALGQIAITVSDVSKALAFYRDVFGLPFLFSPSADLAFLKAGDVRIMLSAPQGTGKVGANSILYFKTSDIENTHAAIITRGVTSERGLGGGVETKVPRSLRHKQPMRGLRSRIATAR